VVAILYEVNRIHAPENSWGNTTATRTKLFDEWNKENCNKILNSKNRTKVRAHTYIKYVHTQGMDVMHWQQLNNYLNKLKHTIIYP
jgi:hypothetical protein